MENEVRKAWTLSQVLQSVQEVVTQVFPDSVWITAEIAEYRKDHQKGHVYLDLVEKKEDRVAAKTRGTLWSSTARRVLSNFRKGTGEELKVGMSILFAARVTFHTLHGFSVNIQDIDPVYTLGEMARKKKEILDRLEREGILELNRLLPLPLVPKVVAVVSSPGAAGYGDFCRHLEENQYGYRFLPWLFPARMQGEETERSIIGALAQVKDRQQCFDLVVIIRGGGSTTDLNSFNAYELARTVAHFPLPVLSGIGHERDETVLDRVAHTRLKTPTAVAAFLVGRVREFEERVLQAREVLRRFPDKILVHEWHRLGTEVKQFSSVAFSFLGTLKNRLSIDGLKVSVSAAQILKGQRESLNTGWSRYLQEVRHRLMREDVALQKREQEVALLDPVKVLQRGYSIALCQGQVIRDTAQVKVGDELTTRFWKGTAVSRVEETHES